MEQPCLVWGGGFVHSPSRQGTSNLRERDATREPSTRQPVSAVPTYSPRHGTPFLGCGLCGGRPGRSRTVQDPSTEKVSLSPTRLRTETSRVRWQTALTAPLFSQSWMGEDIGLKSVPCLWYLQKLGSGVVKRRSHLGLCGSTAKPKSRSPPSKFRPRMAQRVETNPKCRDQHQDPGRKVSLVPFIVHRDLFFLFSPPRLSSRFPSTPRGVSFLFLNRERPVVKRGVLIST
jgi:hypothetical protein